MVFYILIFIVLLTTVVTAVYNGKRYHASSTVALTIAATALSACFSFIIFTAFAYTVPWSPTSPSNTLPLKALGNSTSTTGSFFLGSGTIDGEQVFEYVVEREDGGFNLRSIPVSDNVTVYEDATASTATYVEYDHVINESWLAPFPILMDGAAVVEFHIPPGSLDQEYEISVTDK